MGENADQNNSEYENFFTQRQFHIFVLVGKYVIDSNEIITIALRIVDYLKSYDVWEFTYAFFVRILNSIIKVILLRSIYMINEGSSSGSWYKRLKLISTSWAAYV